MTQDRAIFVALVFAVGVPGAGFAAIIVDPARPITHRVTVQIIETAPSNGTSAALAGNYNDSGEVDTADFILWRNSLGSTTNLAADGNASRVIDASDYNIWRSNFGRTAGIGPETINLADSAVPEPGTHRWPGTFARGFHFSPHAAMLRIDFFSNSYEFSGTVNPVFLKY